MKFDCDVVYSGNEANNLKTVDAKTGQVLSLLKTRFHKTIIVF